jgi:hypothetical protein
MMKKTANNTGLCEPGEKIIRRNLFSRRDFAKLALGLLGTAGEVDHVGEVSGQWRRVERGDR